MNLRGARNGRGQFLVAVAALALLASGCGGSPEGESTQATARLHEQTEDSVGLESVDEYCATRVEVGTEAPVSVFDVLSGSRAWVTLDDEQVDSLLSPGSVGLNGVQTVEGDTVDVVPPEADLGQYMRVALAEHRPVVGSNLALGRTSGRVTYAATTDADGTVAFLPGCVRGDHNADFRDFSDWARGDRFPGASDAQILDALLDMPEPDRRALFEAYVIAGQGTPEDRWLSTPPLDRMLSTSDVPSSVTDTLTFIPNLKVALPESWSSAEPHVVVCTRLDVAWGGHCARLADGPVVDLSLYLPNDDSVVEVWLFRMPATPADRVAKIGELDPARVRDDFLALSPTQELLLTLSTPDSLADALAGRVDVTVDQATREIVPTETNITDQDPDADSDLSE